MDRNGCRVHRRLSLRRLSRQEGRKQVAIVQKAPPRPPGNEGPFFLPLTGSDTTLPHRRCRNWGFCSRQRAFRVKDNQQKPGPRPQGARPSFFRSVAQRGSAPALGAGGRGFESRLIRQKNLLPPPWRVLQTPLIAGQACNGAALTFRRKTSRQACSGRPCSVVAFTEQGFS